MLIAYIVRNHSHRFYLQFIESYMAIAANMLVFFCAI
jgi:hypothetical protein